ncbi:MAG: polyprenyl diphosphate synthase [Planctomycetota bacterium]
MFFQKKRNGIPAHIAIIQSDGLACQNAVDAVRFVNALRETIAACLEASVGCLSLLVSRPTDDSAVGVIGALAQYMKAERRMFAQHGVRIAIIGEARATDAALRRTIKEAAQDDSSNEVLQVNLMLNYTGRAELVAAARELAAEVAQGKLNVAEINMQCLAQRICSCDLPPVDLLIHTAGITTLTDFLLWKAAYAELLFMDTPWLDFHVRHLQFALADYAERRRTFGALPPKELPSHVKPVQSMAR